MAVQGIRELLRGRRSARDMARKRRACCFSLAEAVRAVGPGLRL